MTKGRIALQLFSLRDALAQDVEGTLRRVAAMGYAGVEPFGLTPETAVQARRLCDELGLTVPSVHVRLPEGAARDVVLDTVAALAPERVVSGLGQAEFGSLDKVVGACERLNAANALVAAQGLPFGVHNHWWEFGVVDGVLPYRAMLERLDPSVFFELDVYWMRAAGVDPAAVMPEFAGRARLLHVKDGPAEVGRPMVALGEGVVDVPGIVRANAAHTEWLIVELDACETDMFEAVEKSLRYLEELGSDH
jgi:sugar phosphate isomerase/epimerase